MRRIAIACLFVAVHGCGPDFNIRKDPDLERISPKELARLKHVRVDPNFQPSVSAKSDWQIHTLLANRVALADGDMTTVAASSREHRKGDWILIDLGCLCLFQSVRQHHGDAEPPPTYRVDTAGEEGFPFTLEFVGPGEHGESVATFPRPVHARFIRITVLEDSPQPWRVAELDID